MQHRSEGSPKKVISVGLPFGGEGDIWVDGVYTTVWQVVINFDYGAANGIQIEYDMEGTSSWSELHGLDNVHNSFKIFKTEKVC